MVGFGLVAWRQVSWSRCGSLLVAAGLCWFATDFPVCLNVEPLSHVCARVEPLDRLAAQKAWIWLAIVNHVLVTFPTGRADRPWQRAAVVIGYLVAIAIPAFPASTPALVALLIVVSPTIRYIRSTGVDRPELISPLVISAGFAVGLA